MRHLLTCLLFALLPFAAAAQTAPDARPALPPCIPLVNGFPAHVPRYVYGQHGEHVFIACRAKAGAPVAWHGLSCLHSVCSAKAMGEAITEVTRASAKVATAKRIWAENVGFDYAAVINEQTPRGALAREWLAILSERRGEFSQ